MSEQLTVFAKITPKIEFFAAAKKAILNIIPETRVEPGCLMFDLYEHRDDNKCLYLFEIWEDRSALASHHAQPYTREVFASYEDWLECPVDVTELRELDIA